MNIGIITCSLRDLTLKTHSVSLENKSYLQHERTH